MPMTLTSSAFSDGGEIPVRRPDRLTPGGQDLEQLLGAVGERPQRGNHLLVGRLLHLLAGVSLPAALLFRARYRAFAGARVVLVGSCLTSGNRSST